MKRCVVGIHTRLSFGPAIQVVARRSCSSAVPPPKTPGVASLPKVKQLADDGDDATGPIVSTRDAVEACYEQWATAAGACSLQDLTRGVKQAYNALGVVVDASVRVPKHDLEKHLEQFLRKGAALAGSTAAASPSTAASPSADVSPSAAFDADASRLKSTPSNISGPSLDSLPLGGSFKYHLAVALKAGGQGAFNPFQFAHPNDYVLEAKLQSFETFQPTKVATSELGGKKKKPCAGAAVAGVPPVVTPTADPECFPVTGSAPSKPSPQHEVDVAPQATTAVDDTSVSSPQPVVEVAASPSASKPHADTASSQNGPDIVDQRVTISTTVPPTMIPRSAKAYVLLSIFVAAPPRRFHAPYDWFYQRIRGYENDNERVALANVFAASTAFGLMKVFDHLVRLCTGHPAEFLATRTATSMMRLPADMTNLMMVKRKYIGLYLSKDGEWTISEVTNSQEFYDYEVPGSDGAKSAGSPPQE